MSQKNSGNFYTEGQFLEFCKSVFGYYHTASSNNIEVVCPRCKQRKRDFYNKKKLAIKLDNQYAKCWVCHYKSKNLFHLIKTYFPSRLEEYKNDFFDDSTCLNSNMDELNQAKQEAAEILPNFVLLATADPTQARIKVALNYLKGRGAKFPDDLWYWKFGIINGFTKENKRFLNRVVVPSYNNNGKLEYYSARSIDKWQKPKYINPETDREEIIFNEINIDWSKELTLVEGVFDLIKCNDNASCLLGSELTPDYKLFQEIRKNKTPVALALDPEASKQTLEIAELLFEHNIPVRIVKLKPKQKDVGAITKEEFRELLLAAQSYNALFRLKSKIASII